MRTSQKTFTVIVLTAALALTAIVYWPGLSGGYVFDDFPNIVDNVAIHVTHSTLAAWANAAWASPASELQRPLASLTFAANWFFTGSDPWPMKATNLAIHLLNGVLLYFMLRELVRAWNLCPSPIGRGWRVAPGEASEDRKTLSADRTLTPTPLPSGVGFNSGIDEAAAHRLILAVTAGWLLLPINLMAVLYVVQRMESLCQVFVLAGLWMYLAGRRRMLLAAGHRGFALASVGLIAGTAIGVLVKESAVLLSVYAFLIEVTLLRFVSARMMITKSNNEPLSPRERGRGEGSGSAERHIDTGPSPGASHHPLPKGEGNSMSGASRHPLPQSDESVHTHTRDRRVVLLFVFILLLPMIVGLAWLVPHVLGPGEWDIRDFTLGQRLLTEPRVLVDYLHWTMLPDPGTLSLYHDQLPISRGLYTPWTTLPAIASLALLLCIAWWLRDRRPLIALGILWFFAAQLLTATIVPLELVYEHRNYFASIGVLLALFSLLLGLRKTIALPIVRGAVASLLLIWFAGVTYLRAQDWSNPLRLAIAEANRHPDSPRANYEAGRLLIIASNYKPSPALDRAKIYLRRASAIPGASSLAEQAQIMIASHNDESGEAVLWEAMTAKLREQPLAQEDISTLISLTQCRDKLNCRFDPALLQQAYVAALSHPDPIARLLGAYADFANELLHDDARAIRYLRLAVDKAPGEPEYRVQLTHLLAIHGMTEEAVRNIDRLRRMDSFGRLDAKIAILEQQAEQGGPPLPKLAMPASTE